MASLQDIIHHKTNNGERIIDFLIHTMDGKIPDVQPHHRITAARILIKHGLPQEKTPTSTTTPAPNKAAANGTAPHEAPIPEHDIRNRYDHPDRLTRKLAQHIHAETWDGADIVRFMVMVMNGESPEFKPHHRLSAAYELLRRGFDNQPEPPADRPEVFLRQEYYDLIQCWCQDQQPQCNHHTAAAVSDTIPDLTSVANNTTQSYDTTHTPAPIISNPIPTAYTPDNTPATATDTIQSDDTAHTSAPIISEPVPTAYTDVANDIADIIDTTPTITDTAEITPAPTPDPVPTANHTDTSIANDIPDNTPEPTYTPPPIILDPDHPDYDPHSVEAVLARKQRADDAWLKVFIPNPDHINGSNGTNGSAHPKDWRTLPSIPTTPKNRSP